MSIEVMQLALRSLKRAADTTYSDVLLVEFNEVIAALRQAIKDEEESFRPDYDTNAVLLERIRELEAQLARQQGQPSSS